VKHSVKDRSKYPRPFFVKDSERRVFDHPDMAGIAWMGPTVHVSGEALFHAIEQVEALGGWLEERMLATKYRLD
jgi:hypothetical protein